MEAKAGTGTGLFSETWAADDDDDIGKLVISFSSMDDTFVMIVASR